MDGVTDMMGVELTIGSRVAYAALNYKRAIQRTGVVVGLGDGFVRVKGEQTGRTSVQMAKYDHGGGCPCGLQAECDCGSAPRRDKVFRPQKEAPAFKPTNPKDAVGIRKAPMSTVSAPFLAGVGAAMMEGALKYGRHNYRAAGVRSSVYYDAVMRHMMSWWEGEDIDPDSGLPHIIKAAACLAVLFDSLAYGNLNDDRPPKHKNGWLADFNKVAGDLLDKYPEPKPAFTAIPQPSK